MRSPRASPAASPCSPPTPDCSTTLHGSLADGEWLDAATSTYPAVVLGSVAAEKLGIVDVADELRVRIGDKWFAVIGILEPGRRCRGSRPRRDRRHRRGRDLHRRRRHRSRSSSTSAPRTARSTPCAACCPPTVNPETPEEVEVTRPSDALAAEDAASTAFTSLFLGLGAVALLVGGIGIANVMVIAVIERRSEIGLRRALGATRAHIRRQFLTEAVLLAGAGGVVGVALGAAVTAIYASAKRLEDRRAADRHRRRRRRRHRHRRHRRSVPGGPRSPPATDRSTAG